MSEDIRRRSMAYASEVTRAALAGEKGSDRDSGSFEPASFPAYCDGKRIKVKVSYDFSSIIWNPYQVAMRKEEKYSFDDIYLDTEEGVKFIFGDNVVEPAPDVDYSPLVMRLEHAVRKDSLTEMCRAFLKEKCNVTEEILEEYEPLKDIRVYTSDDKGFWSGNAWYEPPAGWICLTLKYPDMDKASDERWAYCYHGTQSRFVGSIIKNRLVVPGNRTTDGTEVKIQPGHIEGRNSIFTSPSIHYSSHYVYAWPTEWTYEDDEGETKTYYVRTVFQVRQKPGTFRIERNTLADDCWDKRVSFDDHFKNEEIEWVTEDQDTIIPKGLLLHFSEVPVEDLVKEREKERRARPECVHEPSISDSREQFQENLNNRKLKILWVDDNPDNNSDFIEMIRASSVPVDICVDTESALALLRKNPKVYHVAITDLARKEKREGDTEAKDYYNAGIDFIREARRICSDLPIFMYSSYCRSDPDLIHRALETGANKVCTYDDMNFIINREVEEHGSSSEEPESKSESESESESDSEDVYEDVHTSDSDDRRLARGYKGPYCFPPDYYDDDE